LIEAIRASLESDKSLSEPQEQVSEQLSLELGDSLIEMIRSAQLTILTYESDLQTKINESGKLILELEAHFQSSQAQLKKFHENVDLSKTLFAADKTVISATSETQITALQKSISGMREKLSFHQN
jgi:hypothetical protein